MKQFCKLCVITAFYGIFWIPNAFHLTWNLIQPINDNFLAFSNILYLIPFLLTPFIGFLVKDEEGVLVFLGGIIASLGQLIIASADTLTSYQSYWNQPFTYFPLVFKMFIQIIYVGIIVIFTSKYSSRFKQPEIDDAEKDNAEKESVPEEMAAITN